MGKGGRRLQTDCSILSGGEDVEEHRFGEGMQQGARSEAAGWNRVHGKKRREPGGPWTGLGRS